VPGTLSLANFTDSGSSSSDFISNDRTFDLSLGGNEAGSTAVYQISTDNGATWTTTTTTQTNLVDGTYQYRAVVTDVAGNTANSNVVTVKVDTAASITIGTIALDDVVNAAESQSALAISGTTSGVEDGQTVTVTLNGHDYTATVSGNAWTATVPAADVGALADGGSYTVHASVADVAGNPASADHDISVDESA